MNNLIENSIYHTANSVHRNPEKYFSESQEEGA